MSARDSARARWRADLQDYGAAALRTAGLVDMADKTEKEAAANRAYAALMDELAAAKAEGDPDKLRAVKLRVRAYRETTRSSGPVRIGIVNDFAEPSDAELIEMGY